MADDIFLTPEEQDERAKQWLKDNGLALVVGVVLGLGAVFGYNQYQDKQLSSAEQASALYGQINQRFTQSELADINQQVELLKSNHSGSPYAAKAALIRAKQLSVNDMPAAIIELEWVVDNAKETGLKHAALIRLAKIYLSLGELDKAQSAASGHSYEGFDSYYFEILGDISSQRGEIESARQQYQQAIDSLTTTEQGYSRILTLKLNRLPLAEDSVVELEVGQDLPSE